MSFRPYVLTPKGTRPPMREAYCVGVRVSSLAIAAAR